MSADEVGSFRDDEAAERFGRLLRSAMATWPAHRHRAVDTSFGLTAFTETVDSGAGASLVLLQGGSSTPAVWAELARERSHDRPVMAIETIWDAGRGTQRRAVPDGAAATAWLNEVLDGIGYERVHLLGYSYGGWLALEYAATHSERLLSTTAIEPPMAITGMPLRAWWRMLRMIAGGERAFRSYLSWVRGGGLPSGDALELLVSAQTDFVRRGSPRPRQLTDDEWQQITSPLMIVLGADSKLVPARAAARASDLSSHADVHVIPDAGHAVPTDQPAILAALVRDFLARVDA